MCLISIEFLGQVCYHIFATQIHNAYVVSVRFYFW